MPVTVPTDCNFWGKVPLNVPTTDRKNLSATRKFYTNDTEEGVKKMKMNYLGLRNEK